MKYVALVGAILMAALFGGLTQMLISPMTSAGPPAGIIYTAAGLADAKGFGGTFELALWKLIPWILPVAWVVWIFIKMGRGGDKGGGGYYGE
jgi:hypothetical protein